MDLRLTVQPGTLARDIPRASIKSTIQSNFQYLQYDDNSIAMAAPNASACRTASKRLSHSFQNNSQCLSMVFLTYGIPCLVKYT